MKTRLVVDFELVTDVDVVKLVLKTFHKKRTNDIERKDHGPGDQKRGRSEKPYPKGRKGIRSKEE